MNLKTKFGKVLSVFAICGILLSSGGNVVLAETIDVVTETTQATTDTTATVTETSDTTANETAEVPEATVTETSETEVPPLAVDPGVDETLVSTSTDSTSSSTEAAVTEENSSTTETTSTTAVQQPTLSTDKDDYHPGQTANIFGNLFGSFQNIILKIFGSDENSNNYVESNVSLTTDESGSFATSYTLDNLYRPYYEMVASTPDGTVLAQSYFRDSSIGTYDQCANDDGDGYASGDTGCRFVNGNLNVNNSTYVEGDSTIQRLWIEGYAPGSTHNVTFKYGTTKGGKHAYDYLTSWNASEAWSTVADRCDGITGCTTAGETLSAIPHDPNGSGQFETGVRNFTMRGGSIGALSVPALVSGTYAGDSETVITVPFTVATSGPMCSTKGQVTSCGIVIWFGAHIAKSSEWNGFNGTTGAGGISGSPYHVSLDSEDGASVGSRDNQMSASAIIPVSTINIQKIAAPDAPSFNFTTSGTNYAGFSLTHNATNTQFVTPGSYTVTESLTQGWTFQNLSCTAASSTASVNQGTRTANITIPAAGGATVNCYYRNVPSAPPVGGLIVKKVLINDNGGTTGTTSFSFVINGATTSPFEADAQNDFILEPGQYNVVENAATGYTTTYNGCNATVTAGATTTCTITNNDSAPSLTLNKIVTNNNGGTSTESAWTLTASGPTPISGPGAAGSADVVSGAGFSAGTYTLSESAGPAGYAASAWTCTNNVTVNGQNQITLGLGQTTVCSITNNDIAPSLTLNKVVVNNNGGNALATDWTLTASGPTGISGATGVTSGSNFSAGSYALSESNGPSGYTASSWVCTGTGTQNGANISLALGQSATCTITNDDVAPTITLIKQVINNNGGTATPNQFGLTVGGASVASGEVKAVSANTPIALNEAGLAGYNFVSITGAGCPSTLGGTATVLPGQNITCTITNDDIAPQLVLIKQVSNTHGGTSIATDWTLTATGTTTISGKGTASSTASFGAGSYALSETSTTTGYQAGQWSCTGSGTQNGANVTLAVGQSAICSIINSDLPATLIVKKVVINDNGGIATANSFSFGVNGAGTTTFEGDAQNDYVVNAGTYNVVEVPAAGYTTSYDNCSNIVIANGGTATCTITNNDNAPILHLRKVVINDNGGTATTTDFMLTANGTGANDITGTSPVDSGAGLKADTFALSETGVTGYAASDWSCNAGIQNGASITLAIGQEATCTITNNDIAPKLTLVKNVSNTHGGNAIVSDFPLFVNGNGVTSSIANTLSANVLYTASETNLTGYTAGTWGGDCAANGTITLQPGDNKTCTITNSDQSAHIVLIKNVINDNGGTATPNDFGLKVGGNNVTSSSTTEVNSNVAIALTETGLAGYAFTGISGDAKCPSVLGGTVTLDEGETVTCTITNNDIAPKLIVIKNVVNDNGGTKTASDFTMNVNATNASDDSFPGASGTGTTITLNAGSFSVTEDAVSGYTQTGAVGCEGTIAVGETKTCTITNNDIAPELTLVKQVINDNGGTATSTDWTLVAAGYDSVSPDAGTYNLSENGGPAGYTQTSLTCSNAQGQVTSVTLGLAEKVTCTFVNDDVAPKLTLVKQVVNQYGTPASPTAWTLTASGTTPISGAGGTVSGASFSAGAYALSESAGPAGYSAGTWSCVGGQQNGANITLGIAQEATCTIVNTAIAPKLTVIKHVINNNGGTKAASDFTMNVTATEPSDDSFPGSETGTMITLDEGAYSVDETGLAGYAKTLGENCSGEIAIGQEKTCTITNDDIAPSLTLNKIVVNDEDGTESESAWTLTANGPTTISGAGAAGSADVVSGAGFKAGIYTLSESAGPAGYTASGWTCDNGVTVNGDSEITLGLGQSTVCSITNNDPDIKPVIEVTKTANPTSVNEPGGNVTYTFVVTNTSPVDPVEITSLSDDKFGVLAGDADCKVGTVLPVGGSCTFDSVQAIAGEGDTTHTNVFTAHAKDNENNDATDSDDAVVEFLDVLPSITVEKTANPTSVNEPGANVAFTFKVTNTSTVDAVTITSLTDDVYGVLAGDADCKVGTVLAVGASCEFTENHMVNGDASGPDHHDTFTAVAKDNENNEATDSDDATVTIEDVPPTVTLDKSVDDNEKPEPGGVFNFTLTITNTSLETVTITDLKDDNALSAGCLALIGMSLVAGASTSCTYPIAHTNAGVYPNKAEVTVTDNDGSSAKDDDNETVTVTDVLPTVDLVKDVDVHEKPEPGGVFTYTLTVTNNSVEPVTITALTDTFALSAQCTALIGQTLAVGESKSCQYTKAQTVPGTYPNTANVTVKDDENNSASDSDSESVKITFVPTIKLVKSVINNNGGTNVAGDWTLSANGSSLSFSDNGATGVFHVVTPGVQYTLSESGPTGYTAGAWSCTGGTLVGNKVTLAAENDITCTIVNDDIAIPTRTQGFWQTHTDYTTSIFNTIKPIVIGGKTIDSPAKLFSGFYSAISKTSTGGKRSSIDQARMQMLQQWLAAKLNCAAFGCTTATKTMLTDAAAAFAGTNETLIKSFISKLDAYNNSGDSISISANQGSASPKNSQSLADSAGTFWNILP